jgi:hypothetical protein
VLELSLPSLVLLSLVLSPAVDVLDVLDPEVDVSVPGLDISPSSVEVWGPALAEITPSPNPPVVVSSVWPPSVWFVSPVANDPGGRGEDCVHPLSTAAHTYPSHFPPSTGGA